MTAPSVTLRSLQNEETGIDLSVPRFQEEEAPLGGVSILYEIYVLTKLDLFKSRLHRNEDVVQFSIYKAYREIEDLCNKLNKKYPKAGLPPVPKSSTIDKYSSEDKVAALNRFMQAVSNNVELCYSSTFTHFIGINSQRLPSFSTPNVAPTDSNANSQINESTQPEKEVKDSEDLSNVFPKVKNTAVNRVAAEPAPVRASNVDLFAEVKIGKDSETGDIKKRPISGGLFDDFEDEHLFSTKPIPKPTTSPPKQVQKVEVKPKKKEPEIKTNPEYVDDSQIIIKDRKMGEISLFDEQDLGDYITKEEEALFLVSPKNNERSRKNDLLFSDNSESVLVDSGLNENLDDLLNLNPLPSSPSPKVTEFKQLLKTEIKPDGDKVSKEKVDSKEAAPERLLKTEIEPDTEKVSEEKVDSCVTKPELLLKSEIRPDSEIVDCNETELPKKPVPLPRKKSLGKCDTDELNVKTKMSRPEVKPRKVFLAKPEVPIKPSSTVAQEVPKSSKPPPISAKPVLPPKPKPPPKAPKPNFPKDSKDLDALNANKPQTVENQNSVSRLSDDLNKLDILKYIEQEQKTLESEPSLFD